jgi:hypothetical protein
MSISTATMATSISTATNTPPGGKPERRERNACRSTNFAPLLKTN